MQVLSRFGPSWSRVREMPPGLVDGVLGTAFVVAGILSTGAARGGSPEVVYEPRDPWAFVLILCSTTPYFLRRRAPLPVFVVATGALLVLAAQGYNEGVIPLMSLVGAYTVGAHRPAPEAALAAVLAALVLVVLYSLEVDGFDAGELVSNITIFGSSIVVGRNVQARRLRHEALERGQAAATARAASDERLRIAQELHDVVAHSLGVIAVQAGVGAHVFDTDPDQARRALEHISRTSRSSLAEIRQLLGVIRADDGTQQLAPAPDLAELPRLVAEVERAGLPVDLRLRLGSVELPVGLELAAYRIVQESLTNSLRHAAAAHATVDVHDDRGTLVVEVTDDGRGPVPSPAGGTTGHGLVGIRERAALCGGTLDAGPGPGGGFRVVARLPYDTVPA